jgi:TATA-box binding protein (TBP) (component of TFIID and TFIIIB)
VVSITVMVWLTEVLWLPQLSVAIHVRVTEYVPAQLPGVVASVNVISGVASQSSVAVGGIKLGVPGHDIVTSAPAALNTGATLSITVMVWLTGALTLPQSSVPIQVRVTEYDSGQLPGVVASVNVMVTLVSHASVPVGGVNCGDAIQ